MTGWSRPWLALVGATIALAAVAAIATPAAAAPPDTKWFLVDHQRGCVASVTNGSLHWPAPQPGHASTVDVRGTLADQRPSGCEDPAQTYVQFTGYVYQSRVDSRTVWLDPPGTAGVREFEFTLTTGVPISLFTLDRVDIQVCHTFDPAQAPVSCGEKKRYVTLPPILG